MMGIFLRTFELWLAITLTMDPSLLRFNTASALRLHDEFRLLNRQSRSLNRMMDTLKEILEPSAMHEDVLSTMFASEERFQRRRSLDLNGVPDSNKDLEQLRHPRQILNFRYLYRQHCSSSVISTYMSMMPDPNQAESYRLYGGFSASADYYDAFIVFRNKANKYQFINRKANRTVCVHSDNGSLYTMPLTFLTTYDSHECVFDVLSTCNRSWCVTNDPQNTCGNSNVYLTTVGLKRALAIAVIGSSRNSRPELITIPWSDNRGPVDGCHAPPRGCYVWRQEVVLNCGVDGDGDGCVTFSTTKSPPLATKVLTSSTSTVSTAARSEARKCAVNYCRARAELRRQNSGHSVSPNDVSKCVSDFLAKIQQSENLRSRLCLGFVTNKPVPAVTAVPADSPSNRVSHISANSPYALNFAAMPQSSDPEDVASSRNSDLRETYREDDSVGHNKPQVSTFS